MYLFTEDFKSYMHATFLKVMFEDEHLIFVVQLPINITRILSVKVAAIIPQVAEARNKNIGTVANI